MMYPYYRRSCISWIVLTLLLLAQASFAQETLTLEQAEQLALRDEPGIKRFSASAEALAQRAIADSQLPDPKLSLGMLNFPTDTFNRAQEPMTQLQLGIQQAFPRGDSLGVKARRNEVLAGAQHELATDQRLKTIREVRMSWLELYYWLGAERIIGQNRGMFTQLVEVTQQQYAVGRHNQQDVIRAQLELSLLDDKMEKIRIQQEQSRAELARWILGDQARFPLPEQFPQLPQPMARDALEAALSQHPLLQSDLAKVMAGQESVALAREAYKPGWSLGVNYGFRDGVNPNGSERADFLSAMVTVDLPIFRDKRQDRSLAASQYELDAMRLARDERLRALRQKLDSHYVQWQRLGHRAALYADTLQLQAQENAQATLLAYQNDSADFAALTRARITELDTHLQALRIRVDRAKAQANLLYLSGGVQ
jgi:outer membrane protein TolC